MTATGRWFRVNTTWSQSEWLAVLPPASRLAWIELIGYVKAHGYDGKVRAVSPVVFGRMYGIDPSDVVALLEAARADGALTDDGGDWCLTGWTNHQGADGHERLAGAEWDALRRAVFLRDGFTCVYCGTGEGPFECDHVVPVSRGGGSALTNLVTACRSCNRSKRDRTPDEWRVLP